MPSAPIFISYSSKDSEVVKRLSTDLALAGAVAWIDHEQLEAGTPNWQIAIRRGIEAAQLVVYVASPDAATSAFVLAEVSLARSKGRRVIPFWVRGELWHDCAPLELTMTQYIDGRGNRYNAGLQSFLDLLGLRTVPVGGVHLAKTHAAQSGDVLVDRYELSALIQRGSRATVYQARDFRMGRLVAVKILREPYASDPKSVTRFQREARAASALQHPNIVQVFDFGQSGESYYIVMEFVDGIDLRRYLKSHGILSDAHAIVIAHDVALSLGAAHRRGTVHRNVIPGSILLGGGQVETVEKRQIKLTDFSIALFITYTDNPRLTDPGSTLGTAQYYAPEQAQGEIVSPAADIYSLGIVMYEMLTGRTPFDGGTPVVVAMRHIQEAPEPPSRWNPRVAPSLEAIILRCLEKDPHNRYYDGDALAHALEISFPSLFPPKGSRTPPASVPVPDVGIRPWGPASGTLPHVDTASQQEKPARFRGRRWRGET